MNNFDVLSVRQDFPILHQTINGKPLVYLDNAATTQKPASVIESISDYYKTINSNVHRGVHTLSQKATESFEKARQKVQNFINAKNDYEVIFTKGTTDSINMVAQSFAQSFCKQGDEIVISFMEHHSNIVPWQMVAKQYGLTLKVIPIDQNGELVLDDIDALLSDKTKLVAITHVSNTLGTINPIELIIEKAHQKNIKVLIDGAQAISHKKIDVQKLDCDFYCFSGHKMLAATGIGVLYGKEELLNTMEPYQGGGDMIKDVTFEKTTYNELPFKFEAGTPNIEGAISLIEAIKYLEKIDMDSIAFYEDNLLKYATKKLLDIQGLRIIGTAPNKTSVVSFVIENLHHYDIGFILDKLGIAVRTGHHCTQPIMKHFGIEGTVRASFAFYNTIDEIDQLVLGIEKAVKMLK